MLMLMVIGMVVAVDCRAPAFSQRQSRLRKADELTLPFRLAGPIHGAGAHLKTHYRKRLCNAVTLQVVEPACRIHPLFVNRFNG